MNEGNPRCSNRERRGIRIMVDGEEEMMIGNHKTSVMLIHMYCQVYSQGFKFPHPSCSLPSPLTVKRCIQLW
jgi:hypothetical protein